MPYKKVEAPEPIYKAAPGFDHKMATATYNIIMKMDDESAFEFIHHVLSNYIEETVQKNLEFFQDVLDKQYDAKIKATRSVIAKMAMEDPVKAKPYADAFYEIVKAREWEESLYRRDNRGRFTFKVKPVPARSRPMPEKRAEQLGVVVPKGKGAAYSRLTAQQKAQYQAEYAQIKQFLESVDANAPNAGDMDITYRVEELGRKGNVTGTHTVRRFDTSPPVDLMIEPGTRIVAAEARSNDLKMGTVPYSMANAATTVGGGLTAVSGQLDNEHRNAFNTNDVRYQRVGFAADMLGTGAAPGSKRWAAAQMGQFVGSHGSEAEKVFGPSMRKTAYRYRGVEKAPDDHLVTLYDREVMAAKMKSVGDPGEGPAVPGGGRRQLRPRAARAPMQIAADRAAAQARPADSSELRAGRRALAKELKFKLPDKALYELQLASGNTPPSEGVLIDKNGKVVSQAIGYGDDHYLPFNLRNLAKLRGGEYVRTRSVGGPTSEDIYVGLMSGAQAITVVSRSGTYTVQFEEDFTGGRRYNDKALRMTKRYQQILDAVQSEQVVRSPVPPGIKQKIKERIDTEYAYETAAERRRLFKEELDEYKKHPELTDEDEAEIADLARIKMAVDPQKDGSEALRDARADIMRTKALYFKLDGQGYDDALNALREQFPYYIGKPTYTPDTESPESKYLSTEKDKGYVEPGRNRPTQANAGWYGTGRLGDMGNPGTGPISASKTNYQRGIYGTTQPRPDLNKPAGEKPAEPEKSSLKAAADAVLTGSDKEDAAVRLIEQLRSAEFSTAKMKEKYPILDMNHSQLKDHVKTEAGKKDVEDLLTEQVDARLNSEDETKKKEISPSTQRAVKAYRDSGERKETGLKDAHEWGSSPAKFTGSEYDKGAPAERKGLSLMRLNERVPSLHDAGPLAEMDDRDLERELATLVKIRDIVERYGKPLDDSVEVDQDELKDLSERLVGKHDFQTMRALQLPAEKLTERMLDIQRIRTLKANGARLEDSPATRAPRGPDSPRAALRGRIDTLIALLETTGAQGVTPDKDERLQKYQDLLDELKNETGKDYDIRLMSDHQVDVWRNKLA